MTAEAFPFLRPFEVLSMVVAVLVIAVPVGVSAGIRLCRFVPRAEVVSTASSGASGLGSRA